MTLLSLSLLQMIHSFQPLSLNIQSATSSLETCLSDIQTWMLENKLKLNDDKVEALLMLSCSKSFSVSKPTAISVCGCGMYFFFCQKSWFYITNDLSIELHLKNICQLAYFELCRITIIRHLLSIDSTRRLVSAYVISRLHNCNSLL